MVSEGIVVAIISAAAIVLGALIALVGRVNVKINKVGRDVRVARDQVANAHVDENGKPINMRDEFDDRHREITKTLQTISLDIGGIRQDNRQLRHDHGALAERVDHLFELETTRDRRPKPKPKPPKDTP